MLIDSFIPLIISFCLASFNNLCFIPFGGATNFSTFFGRLIFKFLIKKSPIWVCELINVGIIKPFAIGFLFGFSFPIFKIFLSSKHIYPLLKPSFVRIFPETYSIIEK